MRLSRRSIMFATVSLATFAVAVAGAQVWKPTDSAKPIVYEKDAEKAVYERVQSVMAVYEQEHGMEYSEVEKSTIPKKVWEGMRPIFETHYKFMR